MECRADEEIKSMMVFSQCKTIYVKYELCFMVGGLWDGMAHFCMLGLGLIVSEMQTQMLEIEMNTSGFDYDTLLSYVNLLSKYIYIQ